MQKTIRYLEIEFSGCSLDGLENIYMITTEQHELIELATESELCGTERDLEEIAENIAIPYGLIFKKAKFGIDDFIEFYSIPRDLTTALRIFTKLSEKDLKTIQQVSQFAEDGDEYKTDFSFAQGADIENNDPYSFAPDTSTPDEGIEFMSSTEILDILRERENIIEILAWTDDDINYADHTNFRAGLDRLFGDRDSFRQFITEQALAY